jgi:hypothetical protein
MPRNTRNSNKKARLPKPLRITDLNVHIRLHIYGFLNVQDLDAHYPGNRIRNPQIVESHWGWDTIVTKTPWTDSMELYTIETAFASILGDLELLQYLHSLPDNKRVPEKCISGKEKDFFHLLSALMVRNGNWKTMNWARSNNFHLNDWSFNAAIDKGFELPILRKLHQVGYPWSEYSFAVAVRKCDLNVLKWLRNNDCPWCTLSFAEAVQRSDWDILIWLRVEGCPWDSWLYYCVMVRNNHPNRHLVIRWLLREKCPYNSDTIYKILEHNDLPVLQLMIDENRQDHDVFDAIHFYYATSKCSIEILRLLRRAQCPWNAQAFKMAVKRGDMEILRWLRAERCPWDSTVFSEAIEKDNLEIIRWLYEEKCPPSNDAAVAKMMEKYVLVDRQE